MVHGETFTSSHKVAQALADHLSSISQLNQVTVKKWKDLVTAAIEDKGAQNSCDLPSSPTSSAQKWHLSLNGGQKVCLSKLSWFQCGPSHHSLGSYKVESHQNYGNSLFKLCSSSGWHRASVF